MCVPSSDPSGLPIPIVNKLVKNIRRWVLLLLLLLLLVLVVVALLVLVAAAVVEALAAVVVLVLPLVLVAVPVDSLSLRSCNMLCVFQACRILRRCSALMASTLSDDGDNDDGGDDEEEEEGRMSRKHRKAVILGLHKCSCRGTSTMQSVYESM